MLSRTAHITRPTRIIRLRYGSPLYHARPKSATAVQPAVSVQSREAFLKDSQFLSVAAQLREVSSILEDIPETSASPAAPGQTAPEVVNLQKELAGLHELFELTQDTSDTSMLSLLGPELVSLHARALNARMTAWLPEPTDALGAFVHVRAGSGGTESCDWAAMLVRMYTRWAQRAGLSAELVESTADPLAGFKAASLLVDGARAFGRLRAEAGVHRLVRFSPFDRSGARHTSFASVRVVPALPDDGGAAGGVEVKPSDVRVSTMRAQGAGGQHVNKTESAVRLVHVPTGVTVTCQQERSQHQNRTRAFALLRSKLYELQQDEAARSKHAAHAALPTAAFGAQVRSYTLQPDARVKDARTGVERRGAHAAQDVLDGDLDGFIEGSLRLRAKERAGV